MTTTSDSESHAAADHLYRLAQAEALLRLYAEAEGHPAASMSVLVAWVQAHPELPRPITPVAADHEAVARAHPDLVALAKSKQSLSVRAQLTRGQGRAHASTRGRPQGRPGSDGEGVR